MGYISGLTDYDKLYVQQISQYPILSKEETNDLFKQMNECTEDEEQEKEQIREKIIHHNLGLPIYIAKKYVGKGVEFCDLREEGNLALVEAVEEYKYDYCEKTSFSTFAFHHIRDKIRYFIRENSGLIKLPEHITIRINRIENFQMDYYLKNGKEPTVKEISDKFRFTEKSIYKYLKYAQGILYLNDAYTDRDSSTTQTYLDLLPDEKDQIDELVDNLAKESLGKVFGDKDTLKKIHLKETHLEMLKTRYGYYNNNDVVAAEDVAEEFGVTRQAIDGAETSAIKKLRKVLIPPRNKQDFPIDESRRGRLV